MFQVAALGVARQLADFEPPRTSRCWDGSVPIGKIRNSRIVRRRLGVGTVRKPRGCEGGKADKSRLAFGYGCSCCNSSYLAKLRIPREAKRRKS